MKYNFEFKHYTPEEIWKKNDLECDRLLHFMNTNRQFFTPDEIETCRQISIVKDKQERAKWKNEKNQSHGVVYNTIDSSSSAILKLVLYPIIAVVLICLSPLLILLLACGVNLGGIIHKGITGK